MKLFPAIDLKKGSCVRLLRGDMDAATVFNSSPSDQAKNSKVLAATGYMSSIWTGLSRGIL